jgi:predicted DNA-binding transcriptional regulator YafY
VFTVSVAPGFIIGVVFCILLIMQSDKKIAEKWQKKNKERKRAANNNSGSQPEGQTVFIEYEDNKGNFSDRLIDIHRLYKKGSDTYIDAYCYLSDGDRTFRLDRILSMREGSRKGRVIKWEDQEEYLTQLYKKPVHNDTTEDLAKQALE